MLTKPQIPTFLFGIPSVENDVKRRKAIRQTYLSFFKDSKTPHHICSLRNYTKVCQVAYAFFVGANSIGPTELLDPNASFPITISAPNSAEDDIVYLNIKENQMDGKMTTWFRSASQFTDFDYIAKVDDDTLIFTPNSLEYVQDGFPDIPHRLDAGVTMDRNSCDPEKKEDHACSLPLVGICVHVRRVESYVTRLGSVHTVLLQNNRRSAMTLQSHEDVVSLPNFVFSIGDDVRILDMPKDRVLRNDFQYASWEAATHPFNQSLWGHSVTSSGAYFKSLRHWREFWRRFVISWESNFERVLLDIYHLFDDLTETNKEALVHPADYIYALRHSEEEASPVVVERYKLVLFPVPGAGDIAWRDLLYRMQTDAHETVDHRLKRLFDYNVTEASHIMFSSDYTCAMMVRDPKERLVELYQDIFSAHKNMTVDICPHEDKPPKSFPSFLQLLASCSHITWRPQGQRMDPKYYPYLTTVLQFNSRERDAKTLLQTIGAWGECGHEGLLSKQKRPKKKLRQFILRV